MTSWPVGSVPPNPANIAECTYWCYDGRWVLVKKSGGPEFVCELEIDESCTEGDVLVKPAKQAPAPGSLPENVGEYVYNKGADFVYLSRGDCGSGYQFPAIIPIQDLQSLAPQAASLISSLYANSSVTTLNVLVPAQPVA